MSRASNWDRDEKSEGEVRVAIRQARARLANAEAVVRRRKEALAQAELERNERFSREAMQAGAAKAAEGLNLANIDELRSLKVAPPPIAQLVMRCVSTLISGDDIGDAEALDAAEGGGLSARSISPRSCNSARSRQETVCDRLAVAKSPRGQGAHSPVPMSARGERPMSARGERPMSARGERPMSARGERPMSARGERPTSARGERSTSARGERPISARSERLTSARSERPISARGERPMSARGEQPLRAQPIPPEQGSSDAVLIHREASSISFVARQGQSPSAPSTARESSPRGSTAGVKAEAARDRISRVTSPRTPAVRESDVRRGKPGDLVSWEDSLKMMGRTDFKWRVLHLDGRTLLDNRDLIVAVQTCLDLSSIMPKQRFEILPGRAHPGDQFYEARAQRELTSALYDAQSEAGVALNPLTYEAARYVNEVTGAMLIWIHRIFAQHTELMAAWKVASAAVDAAQAQVGLGLKLVAQRELELEALLQTMRGIQEKEQQVNDVPKPTELTTPDQVVLRARSPNIFFQNGRFAARCVAGSAGRTVAWELQERHRLPATIQFYVRLKSVHVPFPLPPRYPAKRYLFEARTIEGSEECGPVAHVPFDAEHVIGLADHHLLTFTQLVIEVPSSLEVNPDLRATRLSFHPRHDAQLHNYALGMQRVIVPVFATGGISSERASSAPPRERPNEMAVDHQDAGRYSSTQAQLQRNRRGESFEKATMVSPTTPVPPLGIAKPPQIGSPFNANVYSRNSQPHRRNEADVIVAGRGIRQQGCPHARRDACVSRFPSPEPLRAPLAPLGQRSVSPSSRAAAARVAAFRAEALMAPYVKRVAEGYVLLPDEMQRMRQLADVVQRRPQPSPTFLHGSAATYSGTLPSEGGVPFRGRACSSAIGDTPRWSLNSAHLAQPPLEPPLVAASLDETIARTTANPNHRELSCTERPRSRRVSPRS